jgi:hypothetical protein
MEAGRWQTKSSGYGKQELSLQGKVDATLRAEQQKAERRRALEQQQAQRQAAADRAALSQRIERAESAVTRAVSALRSPKQEKLRILLLGSSAAGDLRVGREQSRIRAAVERALHRDAIELDVRPAATTADLLDGITRFRPHVVHFSGHSDEWLIEFEDDRDEPHEGVVVTAAAFAAAVMATDDPPVLVFLNSCSSAPQAERLVAAFVPLAIGMADEIADADAIAYAAQFYAAVANGQSVNAAHLSGCAALELAGLGSADLPTLTCAAGVDVTSAVLVRASA